MAQDPREHMISAAKRSDRKSGLAERDHDANTEHPVLCCEAESGATELRQQKAQPGRNRSCNPHWQGRGGFCSEI